MPPPPVSSTSSSAPGLSDEVVRLARAIADQGDAAHFPDGGFPWLLQALVGAGSRSQPHQPRMLIANGIPTVPRSVLLRIQRGEFVDLAELLPAVNSADSSEALGGQATRFSLVPGFEVVRRRRRPISSITDWVQAFLVYMAAVVTADPSMTLELLAYALTIVRASQHFEGLHWRAYDTHFRINAAASGNRSWSSIDTDLYTRFFTGRARPLLPCRWCDSTAHSDSECTHKPTGAPKRKTPSDNNPPPKRRNWPGDVCALFNAKGSCAFGERCKYRHVCGECGADHAARVCSSKKTST